MMLRVVSTLFHLLLTANLLQAFVGPGNQLVRCPSTPHQPTSPRSQERNKRDTWQSSARVVVVRQVPSHPGSNPLRSRRLEDQIDENSRKRVQGGVGETAAGAILGGLLLGPFGMYY